MHKNCLLKHFVEGQIKGRKRVSEDEEEDVSSYWMTLRKGQDIGKWKGDHWLALYGELAMEADMELCIDRLLSEWMSIVARSSCIAQCCVKLSVDALSHNREIHHSELFCWPCHGSGSRSAASYRGDQSMWDLCQTKWHWKRFFFQYFTYPLSVSFHHCSILIHPSTTHAV